MSHGSLSDKDETTVLTEMQVLISCMHFNRNKLRVILTHSSVVIEQRIVITVEPMLSGYLLEQL